MMDERLKEIKVRLTDGHILSYPSPTDGVCYLKAKFMDATLSLDDDGTHMKPNIDKLIIKLYDREDKEVGCVAIYQGAIIALEMTKLEETKA